MSGKLLAARWPVIAGLIIATVGIIAPIVWDLWKSRANVELMQLEEVEIIKKQDDLKKLVIMYGKEELDNLTRIRFIFSNTGTKPILSEDLIKPLTITFEEGTKVLDTRIEAVYPSDLEATVSRAGKDSRVQLRFPLLNPGDNITFSLLIAGCPGTPFGASARIVGVEKLSIVKPESEPKRAQKSIPLHVTILGVVSMLCFAIALLGIRDSVREWKFKRKLADVESIIPPGVSEEELIVLIKANLSWTTTSEREPILTYIEALSGNDISEKHRERLNELIEDVSAGAISNIRVVAIFAIFTLTGAIFVGYQLL